MTTRYRAFLDGAALDEIAESIIIMDIVEDEPENDVISLPLAGRRGSRLQSQHRRSKTVQIRLMIREYDVKTRKDVLAQVLAWAQGSKLEINDRDGLVLYVSLDNVPQISSLKWTETITLSFTAWDVPYWMDKYYTVNNGTGEGSVSLNLRNSGNVEGWVDVYVTNNGSDTVDTLRVAVGGKSFFFQSLGLAAGKQLAITHDNAGLLSMKIGSTSVFEKRTSASVDDLVPNMSAVTTAVYVQGGTSLTVNARVRGLWM